MALRYILYVLKLKLWLRSDSVWKSSSLRHSQCLATIAFILDIYLWWHVLWRFNYNMWSLNVFINDLPCRQVKNQSFQDIRLRPAVHKLRVSTYIWCLLPVAYGGRFGRVFTRLATSPKLWRFNSRGGCRLQACHKPFEHLNRLAVDHNHQTTRSTYARTSTAWDTNKNWLISFLVTKSFQMNSLIRNK